MNKKFIIGSVIVLLTLLTVAIIKSNSSDSIAVDSEPIENRTIVEKVAANGKVQPETEIKISSEVSGELIEVNIIEGQKVKQGELLLRINPDLLTAVVQRASANLSSSKANFLNSKARLTQAKSRLNQSQKEYDRSVKLLNGGAIAQAEMDQITSNFEVAEADVQAASESVSAAEFNVKTAEATLREANDNLGRTAIYAPTNGTISKLSVEEGERVVGTAQMEGTELLRIADMYNMEVAVEVNESDIVKVSLNDRVEIELDAYLDRVFEGKVSEIASSAKDNLGGADQVTTFEVKIHILNSSYADLVDSTNNKKYPLRPGMSATVDVITNTENGVLSVPIQSVVLRPDTFKKGEILSAIDQDKLKECIFLIENETVRKVFVQTGIQDDDYIQILRPNDLTGDVVSGPYATVSRKLRDEDVVEISKDLKEEK
ncbi:efflux RND transporter periplasmic adaptor subunit [Salibacteraceae bacterium]|nr:efflux transporter periplasmic adaptor subunit [Crocinitomicaceae bacterium]MDA7730287.1 efflux RND transporter periplasmic adaptor subunit [Salibacteraceae bacterium]|tara:strand:+ start:63745 stop:65037 length:1293 start_codon:yes stop_codon:yes gene_type:complete